MMAVTPSMTLIEPMTLNNNRQNGVRSLDIRCYQCLHQQILNADHPPRYLTVPSFGPRMVCTSAGRSAPTCGRTGGRKRGRKISCSFVIVLSTSRAPDPTRGNAVTPSIEEPSSGASIGSVRRHRREGVAQTSEIVPVAGAQLVGPLPGDSPSHDSVRGWPRSRH